MMQQKQKKSIPSNGNSENDENYGTQNLLMQQKRTLSIGDKNDKSDAGPLETFMNNAKLQTYTEAIKKEGINNPNQLAQMSPPERRKLADKLGMKSFMRVRFMKACKSLTSSKSNNFGVNNRKKKNKNKNDEDDDDDENEDIDMNNIDEESKSDYNDDDNDVEKEQNKK